MILGVHKKSSRIATLGELGRFPLFVKGLCHLLKYHALLCKNEGNGSLVGNVVTEYKTIQNPTLSSWWGRVEQIKQTLGITYSPFQI